MKRIPLLLSLCLSAAKVFAQANPAPDTLLSISGERILGQVIQFTETSVQYHETNKPGAAPQSIALGNIRQIRYAGGKVQDFTSETALPATSQTVVTIPPPSGNPPTQVQPAAPVQTQPMPTVPGQAVPVPPTQPTTVQAAPGTSQVRSGYAPANGADGTVLDPSLTFDRGRMDGRVYYTRTGAGPAITSVSAVIFTPFLGWIPALAFSLAQPNYNHLDMPSYSKKAGRDYTLGYLKSARGKKAGRVWASYGIGAATWVGILLLFGSK